MALFCKTRNDSSPQGKPKVYFACHPDDFKYFDTISDEILTEVNCAVFYHTQPIENEEAHLRDLSEMNLIVIPITTKFLTTPSAARDIEFPFSQQNHIPVLPLMQEPGLVDDFNKVCGNVQFLDKSARDDTAISYEEKFKNFLTSILVGDELAEEIRNAFDAYIFLSYRKKDRAYAQELMRLIHENDFCRDVAIWYDEFLIPGENFNNTIADALMKSKLFALAITPNLLENPNYVMTTEYPMAKNAGKEILAAELVPTDRAALENHYADIPEKIDARHSQTLANALINALDSIVLRKNDTDPRHNFFIGLAYLSGIDVEKNPERALSLITFAAEHDLPEAIEKLVTMYKTGEGVERDLEKAIKWQEKLVEVYRKQFETTDTEENALLYLASLLTLGDFYFNSYHYDNARTAYQTALDTTLSISERLNDNLSLSYQARCYDGMGQVEKSVENLNQAMQYYHHSRKIRETILKANDTIEASFDLWNSLIHQGELETAADNGAGAYEVYLDAELIAVSIHTKEETPESSYCLAVSWYQLGNVLSYENINREFSRVHKKYFNCELDTQNVFSEVERYYLAASGLLESILIHSDDTETQYKLSAVTGALADLYLRESDFTNATEWANDSHTIALMLIQENNTIQARRTLFFSHCRMGHLAQAQDQTENATYHFREALTIANRFCETLPTLEFRYYLADCYENLGDLAFHEKELSSAHQYYREALMIREALIRETESFEARKALKESYEKLEKLAEAFGDYFLAFEFFSIRSFIKPLSGHLLKLIADLHYLKAWKNSGEKPTSYPNYLSSNNKMYLKELAKHPHLLLQLQAAEAKYLGNIDTALRLYMDANRAHQAFFDEYDDEERNQDLYFDYWNIEGLAYENQRFAIAFTYCRKRLEAQKRIFEKGKKEENVKIITDAYVRLLELAPDTDTSPLPIAEEFFSFAQKLYSENTSLLALDCMTVATEKLLNLYRETKVSCFKKLALSRKLRRYRRLKKKADKKAAT
ncbi:MAG: TIR domain-containing protein [Clostridia bacterium]|nr:TIR domain-containing protein [Clostridia bacterium]